MKARYGIIAVILSLSPMTAHAQDEIKVTGWVVDAAGKPVTGAEVATYWYTQKDKMNPYEGVITNAEGDSLSPSHSASGNRG